jgi:hypothetical protein
MEKRIEGYAQYNQNNDNEQEKLALAKSGGARFISVLHPAMPSLRISNQESITSVNFNVTH